MDSADTLRTRWLHEAAERARYRKALADLRDDEAAALVCLGVIERKMTELEDEWLTLHSEVSA